MPGLNNYSRTNWQTGDVVDEVKLNNIEEQVENITNTLLDNGTASVFSTTSKYALRDLVLYEGYIYKCVNPVTTAGDWTGEENWERTNLGTEFVSLRNTVETRMTAAETRVTEQETTLQQAYEQVSQANENVNNAIELVNSANARSNSADAHATTAVNIAQNANTQSLQALEKAQTVENESAETTSKVDKISDDMDAFELQMLASPDDAFVENGVAYFTRNGEVLFSITGIGGGGGGSGGGGGAVTSADMKLTNTTGWLNKTISNNDTCVVSFTWSSIENELETGPGTMRVDVNNSTKYINGSVPQGQNSIDVAPYLTTGANKVAIYMTDTYGTERVIRCTVIVSVFKLESSLDVSTPFTGAILVPYTPTGSASKTVHFILDGNEIGTVVTSVSGRQQSYTIPQQSHGSHSLRMYFTAELNGQEVTSNELYFELTCIDPMSDVPVITSSYNATNVKQYDTINIPYTVYNPAAMETDIVINVNGVQYSALKVDRTTHIFSYQVQTAGELTIEVVSGSVGSPDYAHKVWTLTVDPVDIDVAAETEALALYLTSKGRSNAEGLEARQEWKYNDISATLTGFNWRINGWLNDDDGVTVLRLNDTARATIPYNIFGNDFKASGKTIEVEFATRDVIDYGATILSCEEGGIGLRITPQAVYFNGAQTKISTLYKENEHIRVSITVEKQSEYRLIMVYINGIASRAIRYASGERFSQLNPVGITIGSSDCGIDIYNIRVYDQSLTSRQIVDNWVADTQIGSLMQERYNRNHIYADNGEVTPNTLPSNLPYMIITGTEQPQYKGDKKIVSGRYVDPVDNAKSFTFENCQINVQGTSSAIYYRKNWDLQFKEGFQMSTGVKASSYALRNGSIPFNRFVLKANVASSEGVNNTAGTMLYNELCPYKTPEMKEDARVRWGIEGVPIVLFWENPDTNTSEFLGQHMFNLPKRAPAPYGYDPDGTDESWEFERNNSDNMKFKSFDTTSQTWDEVKQAYYPTWYDDWEARFPSDEWRNTDKLGEFVLWVASTDRTAATNDELIAPVTYTLSTRATLNNYASDDSYSVEEIGEGSATQYKITFTKDTPAYRLTKFRAEAPKYMELESFEFYYIFTEQLLMIDSRAKNLFIGTHGGYISE